MSENKKSLFAKTDIPDIDLTGVTSQSTGFNNTKYVKKWMMYWNDKTSTDISYTNHWKLGETVEITENHEKFGGLKGKIALGFSKDSNELCVKLKDGKKEFVDKDFIRKISIYDYLD